MRKTALCALAIVIFIVRPAYPAEDYDPQNTLLALNMAVVSVHRILTTQSRAVLDVEYQNIINNLNLGNIRSDPEITALYEKLLDITSRKKLRTEEAQHLRKLYDEQSKRSISGALSDLGKSSAAMIREDGSINAFFGSFSSLVSVSAATYFKYQTSGITLSGTLDENLYRLSIDDLADFNDIQKQLLSSSWNIMNRYNLPDQYRLVQRAVEDFSRAIETPEPSRRLRMLQAMEADFRVYPPYWYYRAKAAQDSGDLNESGRCFDVFGQVWRPVLRRDPYMLESAKYRIGLLLQNGLPDNESARNSVLELCSVMRENTMRDDWVNNLFAGAIYYALGEKEAATLCLEVNIDFGYEHELSSAVLQNMKLNLPADKLLSEALRLLKLNELTANLASPDRQKIFMVADCLDDKEGAADSLKLWKRSPAETHVLRISLLRHSGPEDFSGICALAEIQPLSGDEVSRDYAIVMPLLKTYSDDENAPAMMMLGDMYLYGLGVSEDIGRAKSLYFRAGEQGELYAQTMYISLLLSDRKSEPAKVPAVPEAKPKKKRKPLLRFWPFKW